MRAGTEARRDLVRRELCRMRGVLPTKEAGMRNALIVMAIAAILLWAVVTAARRFRRGSECCGEHGASVKRIRVRDRNPSHYPYAVTLTVGGMVCENCAAKVENALNALGGVWASVDQGTGRAVVRAVTPPDEDALREAVRKAGYAVIEIAEG